MKALTEISALLKSHEAEKAKRTGAAKARLSAETQASHELRHAAMRGVVRRQALTDISQLEGSTVREQQAQRQKYVHAA
jgi:hypothetical protein